MNFMLKLKIKKQTKINWHEKCLYILETRKGEFYEKNIVFKHFNFYDDFFD